MAGEGKPRSVLVGVFPEPAPRFRNARGSKGSVRQRDQAGSAPAEGASR